MTAYTTWKCILVLRVLWDIANELTERQRMFLSFPLIHSIYISASAPLPTVHGWDGLLCSRCVCLILGSLSNVLSKVWKEGRLSASNAQQIVKVSCKTTTQKWSYWMGSFVKPLHWYTRGNKILGRDLDCNKYLHVNYQFSSKTFKQVWTDETS